MKVVGIVGHSRSGKDTAARFLRNGLEEKYGGLTATMGFSDPIKRFVRDVFSVDPELLWGNSELRETVLTKFRRCEIRSSGLKLNPSSLGNIKRCTDESWYKAASYLTRNLSELSGNFGQFTLDSQESLLFWFASFGHKYPTPIVRDICISLGESWGRQGISPQIWVNLLFDSIKQLTDPSYTYDRELGLVKSSTPEFPTKAVIITDLRYRNELDRIREYGGKVIRIGREDRLPKRKEVVNHVSETEQNSFSSVDVDAEISNNGSLSDLQEAMRTVESIL